MSYAGTYGSSETCEHDRYWRSCGICGPTGIKAQERAAAKAKQPDAAKQIIAEERRVAKQRKDEEARQAAKKEKEGK